MFEKWLKNLKMALKIFIIVGKKNVFNINLKKK